MTAKELREQRAALIKNARTILDKADAEKRAPSAEEREAWAKIMGDVAPDGKRVTGAEELLKSQIDMLERQEAADAELRTPIAQPKPPGKEDGTAGAADRAAGPTEEQRALALQAWVLSQRGRDLTPAHQDACKAVGLNPRVNELALSLRRDNYRRVRSELRGFTVPERRAGAANPQAVNLLTSGGALIPEGFISNLEIALLQYGGIRQVADVLRTESGNDLPWPTVNDSGVKGQILSENQTVTTKDMTFGTVVFHAYKYTSGIVLVPVELIEDAAFQLANTIGELCGIRIGRIQSDHFTTGTGAAQPTGLMVAATLGVTAASATAIAGDDLYALKHSVDPAYRAMDPSYMMNDQVLLAVKKLKDGLGRYLWQSSLAGDRPDTIDGDPVVINQSMVSTLAATNKSISYGAHAKYKIRDVSEIRLRRLVERFADADQEAFIMFMRGDGNLLDAGTHPVKFLQH